MLFSTILTSGYLVAAASAQAITLIGGSSSSSPASSSSSSGSSYSGAPTGTVTNLPAGSYLTYASTITLSSITRPAYGSFSSSSGTSMAGNATRSSNSTMTSSSTSTTNSITLIGGRPSSTGLNGTSNATMTSSTSSTPIPTNTQPCNQHPEFCARKYSNITMVAAHNSAFDITNNAASNQKYGSIAQLNDGIRLLQTETHWPNDTAPYLCHTSCDILNVGTLEAWLTTITQWVAAHPYDVITLLIGNQQFKAVEDYLPAFQNSGITQYVYTPTQIPLGLNDWPTLSYMILTRQRVVVFMDYDADQSKVPWILDEFSQMWETPFNPTNSSFPCTVQRPPDLSDADAKNRMYLLNNNLNTEITLLGNSLLVPTTTLLNVTNAANGTGSLGASTQGCYEDWGRPPNFLDVDYYNVGGGSVFEVAARWNNVTYTTPCCGTDDSIRSAGDRTLEVVGRTWAGMCLIVVLSCWMLM